MTRSRERFGALARALVWAVTACAASPPAPLRSGLLLPGYDRQVRPQDDLFAFANGRWLRTIQIPPDRSRYGTFQMVADQAKQHLRSIVENSAARGGAAGSPDQQIGDFYASFMDTARLDALGTAPLKAPLERIDGSLP
jgi:predicted metalloendopeptidase